MGKRCEFREIVFTERRPSDEVMYPSKKRSHKVFFGDERGRFLEEKDKERKWNLMGWGKELENETVRRPD
jgi:hypothetical protein